MSMQLEFEPHSWYFEFAIKKPTNGWPDWRWHAYTDDGNTYRIIQLEAKTLEDLKRQIRSYWVRHGIPSFYMPALKRYDEDGNLKEEYKEQYA